MMSTEEIVLDEMMEMDEDEETCFMCNQNIIGKSFFLCQSKEICEMLCQILKIPHLGKKEMNPRLSLENINYCHSCVDRIKIAGDMLTELERLEKQILEESRSIQLQLKVIYDYYDSKSEGNNSALQFRTAIINELNSIQSVAVQEGLEKKKIGRDFISGRRRETISKSKNFTGLSLKLNSKKDMGCIDQSFNKTNYNDGSVCDLIDLEPIVKLEETYSEYVSCQSPYSTDNSADVKEDPLTKSGTLYNNIKSKAVGHGLGLSISTKTSVPKNMIKSKVFHVGKIRGSSSSTKKIFNTGTFYKNFDTASKLEKYGRSHTKEKSSRILTDSSSIPSPPTSTELIEKALELMNAARIPDRGLPKKIKKKEPCHKCQYCEKAFTTEWHLRVHVRIHTGETPKYICKFCDKIFIVRCEYIRHKSGHTAEEKGLKCRYCGNICKNKGDLKMHERLVHKDNVLDRDFMCVQCGKTFLDLVGLRSHEQTHTGEKPFVCQFCGQHFSKKSTVRNHERTHTGEKPFKCQYCDRYFALAYGRKKHERTIHMGEKPYTCKYCGKLFASGSDWKRHELTHTQERPKACRCCGKKFPTNTDVKVHMRTHPGEKFYKCQYCELQFSYWRILKEHERLFHPDMTIT